MGPVPQSIWINESLGLWVDGALTLEIKGKGEHTDVVEAHVAFGCVRVIKGIRSQLVVWAGESGNLDLLSGCLKCTFCSCR